MTHHCLPGLSRQRRPRRRLLLQQVLKVWSSRHCKKRLDGPSGHHCSGRAWHARPALITVYESRLAESSLSCRPDPRISSTFLRLIRYNCYVLRHPFAVDTPLPTRTLPTATPAPTAPSPTGTQGVVVTTFSKMLGRPQWPSLFRSSMARPTSLDHYLRFPIRRILLVM